ncbi:hypothetical protein F8388_021105 [Cannabis sativa]|uniref:E2F-associated phosphoprotein n=1 Tax=Cannabis sativa TaxID=3483 RepID=A0A7J6GZJ7_CANSA|nr:hypothetical protein F8388_021105 [Cannabis sativa]
MSDTGENKSQGDLELESDKRDTTMDSPVQFSESSDDDEIDYSVKPELYDPELDDKDELWVQKKRKGRHSDAVLSCPACFTTLSLVCQRTCYEIDAKWLTKTGQEAIVTVIERSIEIALMIKEVNGEIMTYELFLIACKFYHLICITIQLNLISSRHEKYLTQYRAIFVVNCKVGSKCLLRDSISQLKSGKRRRETDESEVDQTVGETFKQVHCMVCSTEVGVMDEEEVYHFFNVLPSES